MMRAAECRSISVVGGLLFALAGCGPDEAPSAAISTPAGLRPAILLVTLDTTRADAIGPHARGIETPAFDSVAARGALFANAYATAPETLPSHSSMMTGLYPAAHGVHENARALAATNVLLAEELKGKGYGTAAFVSAYPLDAQFGLGRGFDLYDDDRIDGAPERGARATTERAIEWMGKHGEGPVFIWVHYFDPHYPYEPEAPFASQFAGNPYLGEVAAMDQQLGRLVAAYTSRFGEDAAIIIAGDHGESLGEHGESQHGNLLYQGVMHVPLTVAGPGIEPGLRTDPVSTRRIFHTIREWAGEPSELSLRARYREVVIGEAMRPFLSFGWQPQVMAIEDSLKVIQAGSIEAYDLALDPMEGTDISGTARISRGIRQALRDYPAPTLDQPPVSESLSPEERRQLASLGYVGSDVNPAVREDAPRPADMTHLFDELDRASGLFVAGEFRRSIPVLERIVEADPWNLMAVLRLAAARSETGDREGALQAFNRAREIAPQSADVSHYTGLHYLSLGDLSRAGSLLESALSRSPNRISTIEALASVREREKRFAEALALRQRVIELRTPTASDLAHVGQLAMMSGNTQPAIRAFEKMREIQGDDFANHLELGVLYMDARRLQDARSALDRVDSTHPRYPMALFKRAQLSVLLSEPDREHRIRLAREHADAVTAPLIERERLFR